MKLDVQRLRELLAKFPLPWKLDESFTDFGGRYVGVESSAPSVFEDIAGQNGINQDAAELIAAAVNALPELLAIAEASEWRSIESAPRDRTPVLLRILDELPDRCDGSYLHGIQFVGRWTGGASAWCFAAPVGYGGIPDEWIAGWRPLPKAPEGLVRVAGDTQTGEA